MALNNSPEYVPQWHKFERCFTSEIHPGFSLPEDQAILLSRYMVFRWRANYVAWILNGDSDYRGEVAERWKRTGRAVFSETSHAPVSLHPGGMRWNLDEFRDETWAGVTNGGHGVWGWDDGAQPPVGHANTGIPPHWQKALAMEAAEHVAYLSNLFDSIAWRELLPAPELLVSQPGENDKRRFITASRSAGGELAVIYIPEDSEIELCLNALRADLSSFRYDPRAEVQTPVSPEGNRARCHFRTLATGDWVLVFQRAGVLPSHPSHSAASLLR